VMNPSKTGRLDGLTPEGGEIEKDTLVDCPAPIFTVVLGRWRFRRGAVDLARHIEDSSLSSLHRCERVYMSLTLLICFR
jgi:hypothetical protein